MGVHGGSLSSSSICFARLLRRSTAFLEAAISALEGSCFSRLKTLIFVRLSDSSDDDDEGYTNEFEFEGSTTIARHTHNHSSSRRRQTKGTHETESVEE